MDDRAQEGRAWHEATFAPVPGSVADARRFVRRLLPEDERADLVALLVSELATNAIRHASTTFEVRLQVAGGLRVEVRDQLPLPLGRATPIAGSGNGRGLQILDALATRWGAELSGHGKVVWFEL